MHTIDRLPPGERIQEYLRRAGEYQEFSRTAMTAGSRQLFQQMARDMLECANAVKMPDADQDRTDQKSG